MGPRPTRWPWPFFKRAWSGRESLYPWPAAAIHSSEVVMVRRLPTRKAARVVLIGTGYFAQFHAEAWQRLSSVDLVAVADSAPGRAHSFAAEHKVPRAYESAEEAL